MNVHLSLCSPASFSTVLYKEI